MKLSIHIKEIDFCDLVRKAMRVLQEKVPNDGSATAKIIAVVTQFPEDVIYTMLNAVPLLFVVENLQRRFLNS